MDDFVRSTASLRVTKFPYMAISCVTGSYAGLRLTPMTLGKMLDFNSLPMTNVTCLSFYFTTNGTTVDNLRVVLKTKESITQEIIVWRFEGNSGYKWVKAQIPLDNMASQAFAVINLIGIVRLF